LEAVVGSGYQGRVKAHVRGAGQIPGIAGTSIGSHYEKRKPDFGSNGYRSQQEFIVSVTIP
jgi:hypothetical protein